jgi:signal peptidase II
MATTCNPASAWGLIHDQTLILVAGLVLLFIIGYFWYTAKDSKIRIGLSLVFLGGVMNLGERVYYGCVTDYIKLVSWWPSFNFADVLIVAGIILILIGSFASLRMTKGRSG